MRVLRGCKPQVKHPPAGISNQLWTRTVFFWLVGEPDPMGFLKIGSNSSSSLNYGTDGDGEEGRDLQKGLS